MDCEWNIHPRLNTLQLNEDVKSLLLRLGETPENCTGRTIFMSMFSDIFWDNEQECMSNANLVSLNAKRFGPGQWSFLDPGSEKKWRSLYRAVAEMCEEYETLPREIGATRCRWTIEFFTRAKREQEGSAFGLWWPSISKFSVAVRERIEKLSQQVKLNKLWMQDFWMLLKSDNTSWRKTLRNSHNFMRCLVVKTLCQEKKKHHNQKDGSKETPKKGPYWKLQPVICTVIMELHPWTETILTPGSEFLMDQTSLWWIWTTMSRKFQKFSSKNMRWIWMRRILQADQSLKQNHKEENLPAHPQKLYLLEKTWTDVEPGKYSLSDYDVSKKLIFLRYGKQVHQEDDGAIDFWRNEENLKKYVPHCPRWSDRKWKKSMAGGRRNKKRYQYCTDSSRTIVYLWVLQGHSGRNLIDPSLQDNLIIQRNFQYIYHVGCAFNLHSIINSGLILGGQILNKQTVFFFCVWIPWTKTIKILIRSTWLYRAIQNTCIKRGRDIRAQYHGSTSMFLWRIEVLSDSIECDHSSRNTSSLLYSESCRNENWRKSYEQVYMSPRPPPKVSLKHDWKKELDSEHAQEPERKLNYYLEVSNRTNQFQIQVVKDRGNPLSELTREPCEIKKKKSSSKEIDTRSFMKKLSSDRSEQPVVETSKTKTRSSDDWKSLNVELAHERSGQPFVNHDDLSHEQTMLIEVNMDFRIPSFTAFWCEASWEFSCSWIGQEDREPPRSTCSSTRSTTKIKLTTRSVQSQKKWFRMWVH